jgi:hypothetical protein
MSRVSHIVSLLTNLTDIQVEALTPVGRRLLREQLERVHRMVADAATASDARRAMAPEGSEPRRGRAAFLDELRDGQGRD